MKAIDWFIQRGLRVLNYQSKVLADIKASITKQEVTILAACPSAGKTIMSIFSIEDYLTEHPLAKVLALTHGTTVLRTQFHEVLEEVRPDFTYNLVEKFTDYNEASQLNVCLPQTLNAKVLNKIDLLVVDEAHQFYFADMVQEIIEKTKPKKQLLLTGTPSVFIQRDYKIIPIPMMTIYSENMCSEIRIEIATSSYNFDIISDYNEDKELRTEIEIKNIETNKTLDDLIKKIIVKLNDKTTVDWLSALKQMQKTMFACRSQAQALQVKQYFDNIGVGCALSISDTDSDSTEIQRFKAEKQCLVLIVVGRGILGFSYTRLVNIVDMSTSQNIDRIYQLFSRIARKHPDNLTKLFFKIAPKDRTEYYRFVMTGVLALCSEEFFTKFNGKNFDDLKIPVIRKNGKEKKTIRNYKQKLTATEKKYKDFEPVDFSNLPVFEFFKDVYEKDDTLKTYTLTTMKDVRSEFQNRKPRGYWTLERCVASAKPYNSATDWKIGDNEAYSVAIYYGWYKDCVKHMNTVIFWTTDMCVRNAQKYSDINDWMREEPDAYCTAMKFGWMFRCTAHMKIKQIA